MTDSSSFVRVAAIADTHLRATSVERRDALSWLGEVADVLVVAGDITDNGRIPEVEVAARAFTGVPIPTFAVLGNHDRRGLRRMAMRKILREAGVDLLDAQYRTLDLPNGARIGIAGTTGTGGGFGTEYGDAGPAGRLAHALMAKARREATRLDRVLSRMSADGADVSLLVTHFAPTVSTLGNEPTLKYWMLGNSGLGRVIDNHDIDLAIHGHAHLGNQEGSTPGGTPVRNVAVPALGQILLYHVGPGRLVEYAGGPYPGIVDLVEEIALPDEQAEPDLARP